MFTIDNHLIVQSFRYNPDKLNYMEDREKKL